jgi:hypothetical protein
MKVAYFAESSADAAALTILTEAVLNCKTEPISHAGLRSRGWPSVRIVLPVDELGKMPYTKDGLKRQLYSTSRPSLAMETEAMKKAAERISNDLMFVEKLFPDGFGALLRRLRAW